MSRAVRSSGWPLLLMMLLVIAACGLPKDPHGTLERVRDEKVLRAGASEHPPYVVTDSSGNPSGTEVALIEDYARHLNATVEWTIDSETALVEKLDAGGLDVMVAGLDDESLFADQVGFTRPYLERTEGPEKDEKAHVIGVRMGENALLADLERWLDKNAEQYA